MKIGLYLRLVGRPGTEPPAPTWTSVRADALAAEAAGFDLVVIEDALLYPGEDGNDGVWEAVTMAAALAAATTTIGIGHAVINNPYRHPALLAKTAETLSEISGGRYRLGIGLGNTPDDYPLFGIEADRRYSRFAEAIEIIHGLLKTGRATFDGEFYSVPAAELVLRGPRADGPPIVIAGGKPKMLRLAARYGDEWNWWVGDADGRAGLQALAGEVTRACEEVGRDPATLRRSIDVFSVAAPGVPAPASHAALQVAGAPDHVAEQLLEYRVLGFDEVRVNLAVAPDMPRTAAIAWMRDVVERVHAG